MTDIFVVIDMQRGIFSKPRWNTDGVVRNINHLASAIRGRGGRVIWVQHTDADLNMSSGSAGWQLLPELDAEAVDLRMEKTICNSFYQTPLSEMLRMAAPGRVIFAGYATDFCVDTTVRAGADLGFPVWVAADAHTTAARPELAEDQIIRHHNYVWSHFTGPNGPIRIEDSAQLL